MPSLGNFEALAQASVQSTLNDKRHQEENQPTSGGGASFARDAFGQHAFARHSWALTLVAGFTTLASFANNLVIAPFFGTGAERDAFFVALALPANCIALFASTVAVMLIPTYLAIGATSVRFAVGLRSITWVVGLALGVAMYAFAAPLARLLAPDYGPESLRLTIDLLRLLAPAVPLMMVVHLRQALCQAERRYWRASLPILAGVAAGLVFNALFIPRLGIRAVAFSYTLSAAVAFLLSGGLADLHRGWGDLRLAVSFLLGAAPLVLACALQRLPWAFERRFAAGLPTGAVSELASAAQVVSVFSAVAGAGVAAAILPALVHAGRSGNRHSVALQYRAGLRLALFMNVLPLAMTLALATPLVRVIFQRGAFDAASTAGVSACLTYLAVATFAASLGAVPWQFLLSVQKPQALVRAAAAELATYLLAAPLLAAALGARGLALAAALRCCVGFGVVAHAAARAHAAFDFGAQVWKILAAALVAAVVGFAALRASPWELVALALPPLAYLACARLFAVPEATTLLRRILG